MGPICPGGWGVSHGYLNTSHKPCRALSWVSLAGELKEPFDELRNMTDVEAVVKVSTGHDVDVLPPGANK
jgi:hypothetical protein